MKIQSKFINEENRTLYYEIYFTVYSEKEIPLSKYQEIERFINLKLDEQ